VLVDVKIVARWPQQMVLGRGARRLHADAGAAAVPTPEPSLEPRPFSASSRRRSRFRLHNPGRQRDRALEREHGFFPDEAVEQQRRAWQKGRDRVEAFKCHEGVVQIAGAVLGSSRPAVGRGRLRWPVPIWMDYPDLLGGFGRGLGQRRRVAWLGRLLTWLERFEVCCSRQSQSGALRRYVTGLLSDSSCKSMEAIWARLSDAGTCQAFQHFITDEPWGADTIWKRLRKVVPDRTAILILDGTSSPKQGTASVVWRGDTAARSARAELPDGANRRLVDRSAGVAAGRTPLPARGMAHPAQRARARIPAAATVVHKWQLALTLPA
jgi:hypothetical protein